MIVSIITTSFVPRMAAADPVGDAQAQAAALAQKINSDDQQVNVLAEQYDGAQYHLSQVQQQLTTAEQGLKVAQVNAAKSRAALAGEAVVAYMHGGLTTTETSFSGTVDLAVQEGYFQLAVGSQGDALDQLKASEQALRQEQVALQGAEQDSQAALTSVSTRRQAVAAAAAASQATLNQVKGSLVQLVAQQQAQIAAQEQAQVKASLLATHTQAPSSPTTASAADAPAPSTAGRAPSSTSRTTTAPTTRPATTATTQPPATKSDPVPAPSGGASAALAYARAQIGKPYQWGGAGPDSFDCSGLTMRAWGAGGVSLPHLAAGQYADTAHVPIADLEPGDLVFYGSDLHHVGIYIGGGQMIDAPSTGEFVRIESIYWPDLQPYGGRVG